MALNQFRPILDSAKWDWYQVTIDADNLDYLKPTLKKHFEECDWRSARPVNGYNFADGLFLGDREVLLACYGGNANTCNIKVTGSDSTKLKNALDEWGGTYKPTRFDSCIDWEEEALFDSVSAALMGFARENDLTINQQGDWVRGVARTLYVGSPTSPVQLRLYEKGYQVFGRDTDRPNWVRLEVQVRPAKKRRELTAGWTPADAFCAGWVSEAIQSFFMLPQCKHPIGYQKEDTDRLKRRQWLFKVGSRALNELLEDCGGDAELFATRIIEEIAAAG